MKKTVKKILSVLLSAALLFTLLPAFASEQPREITEVFSAELFSNGAVNEFLKVFPQFAVGIESALHSTPADSPAYVELDPNGFGLSGDLYVKMNGDSDTATFANFFHAYDINVYPYSLGAYLEENGRSEIAAALQAAEGWADFDTGDGFAFDFDWGLEEIDGLAEKYAAFTEVIALLIDAAGPLFAAALGTQDLTLDFPGEMQFFKIVSPAIHMEYGLGITLIDKDLTNVVFSDFTGSIVFPAQRLYQKFVLPLYRALGVSTALDYTFAAWDQNADAGALAALLYDPLYALVSAVQNDPAAIETLISFYGAGCEERVAQIGSGCTQTYGEITVSDASVDFEVSGLTSVQRNALKEALLSLIRCEYDRMGFSLDPGAFIDADDFRTRLNSLLPALTAPAPEIVASGYCGAEGDGTNVEWILTNDGTLTLRGTGATADYGFQEEPSPWFNYDCLIRSAVVEEGVTALGKCTFYWMEEMTSAILPESLTEIGPFAFYCTGLTNTTLPEGLTTIGEYAFDRSELTALPIPASVTSIGEGAFSALRFLRHTVDENNPAYCTDEAGALYTKDMTVLVDYPSGRTAKTYDVPAPVAVIGAGAFEVAAYLEEVTLPETVTEIGDYAFDFCLDLQHINLPEGLTSIGYCAFSVCKDLAGIELPDGLVSVGGNAFSSCSDLKSVSFPDSVTELGDDIFWCAGIEEVKLPAQITEIPDGMFIACTHLTAVTVPDNVTLINRSAFHDCHGLTLVSLPAGLETVCYSAFGGCDALRYVFFGGSEAEWAQLTVQGDNAPLLNAHVYYNCAGHVPGAPVRENEMPAICEMEGGYDEVIYCADCGLEMSRERITLPAPGHTPGMPCEQNRIEPTCTESGEAEYVTVCTVCALILETETVELPPLGHAPGAPAVTVITPPTCTEEGSGEAVVSCTRCGLTLETGNVEIPAPGHAWGDWYVVTPATYETEGLERRDCANNAAHFETRAIPVLDPSVSEVIASGVCGPALQWTLYANGTLNITGTGLMWGCGFPSSAPWENYLDGILAVNIAEGAQTIGAYAFARCTALTDVSIPDTVTGVGDGAFAGCGSLQQIVLPNGVESIGYATFNDCVSLSDVTLPAGLTRIEMSAFSNNVSLHHIDIPAGVTYIADGAFGNCRLEEVTLPAGLEEICYASFTHNLFTEFTVPEGVTTIADWAVQGSTYLEALYLPHSITQIGSNAFYSCYQLKDIYYNGVLAEWQQVTVAEDSFARPAVVHFADGTHLCAPGDPRTFPVEPSTCSGPGSYDLVYYCMECGEELSRERKEIEPVRHVWGDWTILTYPTAAEEGLMERRCLRDETHVETAAIPAGEFGAHELLRGYCGGEGDGKNLIWTLTDDNVITISGEGRMADYGDSYTIGENHQISWDGDYKIKGPDVPWPADGGEDGERWLALHGYTTEDEIMYALINGDIGPAELDEMFLNPGAVPYTVVIQPGVTYIGANAFEKTNVTALSLPATAEEIGFRAFAYLNVRELILPEGVRWLDPQAFCDGRYESVTVPASMEIVGSSAIDMDPNYDSGIRRLTVLCPDERLNDVLSGISVRSMPRSMEAITSPGDYRDATLVRYMAELYVALDDLDLLLGEAIADMEEDLQITMTPEQRQHFCDYILWSFTYELRLSGVNMTVADLSAAFACTEINRVLETSFTPEEMFTGTGTEADLSPAARARFTERFGTDYDNVSSSRGSQSLKSLNGDDYNYIPAPFLILCGHCGSALESEYGELVPFEAVEHDPVLGEVITPSTCVTHGEAAVTCPVCGLTFTGELPLGEHTPGEPVTENELPATYMEEGGYDLVTYCTVCGETLSTEHVTVPPLNHTHIPCEEPGYAWIVYATCTQNGTMDEVIYCTLCHAILSETFITVPATGHNYVSTLTTAPTCVNEGVRTYACTNVLPDGQPCISTYTEPEPALGHSFTSGITLAPTCTEPGVRTYTCVRCPETYTEEEPASGHGTQGYDVSGAPSTCIVRGYSMTVCIACGEITAYQEYNVDPENHNWSEWTVITPATYLTEGLERRECGWCGAYETRPIPVLEPDETISDPETGIELQLQEGVLPENTVFEVDEEFDGTYFMLLNREVGFVSSTLYNITPTADGSKVQPDGYVLVRLPIPAGYNPDTLSIYYISTETGTTERMDCYIEDGYICFQTTHFSVYAIVDSSAPAAQTQTEQPTPGNSNSGSFFSRIINWFRSMIDSFKKLFKK